VSRVGSPVPGHPILDEIEAADRSVGFARRAAEIDRSPEFPWSEFRELGRRGLLGLRTPTASGGRGLPMTAAAVGLHELARRGGTMFGKLSLQPDFSSVLDEVGSKELREEYFRPLVRGEVLIGNQITEPGAGSDAAAISMRAEKHGDGYLLDGEKSQVAFASDAGAALVYARTGGPDRGASGITAFLVPQDLPGIERTVEGDLGERWMRRGRVTYRQVRVEARRRIGEEGHGFEYLQRELTRERLLLGAVYLGVARASLEETVERAGVRTSFGRPIGRHEAVGFALVEDWARLDAAWLYTYRALERFESGVDVDAEAALSKWMATEVALTAIDHAIQFHGGEGYSNRLPYERRWRDVRSGALAHGPSEIMHLIAVRALWPSAGSGSRAGSLSSDRGRGSADKSR